MKLLKDIREGIWEQVQKLDDLERQIEFERRSRSPGTVAGMLVGDMSSGAPSQGGKPDMGSRMNVVPRFVVSSLFLRHAYEYLMQVDEETLAYVSGITLAGTSVLDHLVAFDMDVQEHAYVSGEAVSLTAALSMLSDRGFVLQGTIHSHPGAGPGATHPSGIDRNHHRRLEVGGYTALGIIMTRDGHLRFYTHEMPFEVQVVGRDVDQVERHVFRLHSCDAKDARRKGAGAKRKKK
jgi:hypothetical protein